MSFISFAKLVQKSIENAAGAFSGGVFLEKDLTTRGLFKFLFSMFAAGEAAVPV